MLKNTIQTHTKAMVKGQQIQKQQHAHAHTHTHSSPCPKSVQTFIAMQELKAGTKISVPVTTLLRNSPSVRLLSKNFRSVSKSLNSKMFR